LEKNTVFVFKVFLYLLLRSSLFCIEGDAPLTNQKRWHKESKNVNYLWLQGTLAVRRSMSVTAHHAWTAAGALTSSTPSTAHAPMGGAELHARKVRVDDEMDGDFAHLT